MEIVHLPEVVAPASLQESLSNDNSNNKPISHAQCPETLYNLCVKTVAHQTDIKKLLDNPLISSGEIDGTMCRHIGAQVPANQLAGLLFWQSYNYACEQEWKEEREKISKVLEEHNLLYSTAMPEHEVLQCTLPKASASVMHQSKSMVMSPFAQMLYNKMALQLSLNLYTHYYDIFLLGNSAFVPQVHKELEESIIQHNAHALLVKHEQESNLCQERGMSVNAHPIASACRLLRWEHEGCAYTLSGTDRVPYKVALRIQSRDASHRTQVREISSISKYPIHTMAISLDKKTLALGHNKSLSLMAVDDSGFGTQKKVYCREGVVHTLTFDETGTNILGLVGEHLPDQPYNTKDSSWLVRYHMPSRTMQTTQVALCEDKCQRTGRIAGQVILGGIFGAIASTAPAGVILAALSLAGTGREFETVLALSMMTAGVISGGGLPLCLPRFKVPPFYHKPLLIQSDTQGLMLKVQSASALKIVLPTVNVSCEEEQQALYKKSFIYACLQKNKDNDRKDVLIAALEQQRELKEGFTIAQRVKLRELITLGN